MNQNARILLIESFMHKHWQVAMAGWGSSYGLITKILSKILISIAQKEEITVGFANHHQIPPKSKSRIDFSMIEQLIDANITMEDLSLVKKNREVNGALAIRLATEILEKGFKDFRHIEHEVWKAVSGQSTPYLSIESNAQAKAANFIHLDFSGFLTLSRTHLIGTLTSETTLTPKEIIDLVISKSEQECAKYDAQLTFQKTKSNPLPLLTREPIVIRNKTTEELSDDKKARENGYDTLIKHFNLTAEDAQHCANSVDVNHLRSLWHIKINIMPNIQHVLTELMEKFNGNMQMVEDIVTFEQLMWIDPAESFKKYGVPVERQKYGMNPVSVISNDQSDTLLSLNYDLLPCLIKPLRATLMNNYTRNHPQATLRSGRSIKEFKEHTFLYSWKRMPEFMLNSTDVVMLNDSFFFDDSHRSEVNEPSITAIKSNRGRAPILGKLLLMGDLIIVGVLLTALLSITFRKPVKYAKSLFFGRPTNVATANADEKIVLITVDNKPNHQSSHQRHH